MIYPLFSVKDDLVGYGIPFSADNDAVAMRIFHMAVEQPGSIYELNKSQFNLYFVGKFDTSCGEIISEDPRYVCSALDFNKE